MSKVWQRGRPLLLALGLLVVLSSLLSIVQVARADGGLIGAEGSGGDADGALTSTINGVQIGFAKEYNKTTIWARVCTDAPDIQLRSESVGNWITAIFDRTQASGGCSPSPTSWWRMVYNADPGPQIFRIYATANDTFLAETAFMQRAARAECKVTGYGTGICTPSLTPPPTSFPVGYLDEPVAGANVSGDLLVRGWVADGGSWSGPGVSQVEVLLNGAPAPGVIYGESRPDVAAYLGDSRFTASGYRVTVRTQGLTGPATLQVRYKSAISGATTTISRQINITPSGNISPNPPTLVAPANSVTVSAAGVTLQVRDGGDPDNGPSASRSFRFRIARTDGSWSQEQVFQPSAAWAVTLPSPGVYQWQAWASDGAASSAAAGPWNIIFAPPDRILNVRYVDQVFAQRTPMSGWWVYCGPSSLAMLLNYYGVEKRDVFTSRAPTVELAREMKVGLSGTPGGAIPAALRRRGLDSLTRSGALSEAELKASIDTGNPVLFSLSYYNHILLLVGYRANGNFVVNDPFGGRYWPKAWSRTANRNDAPWTNPFDTPRTKGATLPAQGQYVEYSYAELRQMGIKWTTRVTGPTKALQLASAQVNPAGDTFTGQQIQVLFGQASTTTRSAVDPIDVTYAPSLSPAQPLNPYAGALAAFRLSAADGASQPLTGLAAPFTIQLDLDPAYAQALMPDGGVIGGDGLEASPGAEGRPIAQSLVLARWDESTGSWVELTTSIDMVTSKATAQSSQFGDFALLIRPDQIETYLPIVVR